MVFYYTPQDAVSRIYPYRGYTPGNELVKVYLSYFHDKTSPQASCKFTYVNPTTGQEESRVVNVIDYDHESITCFHPPAYLFSEELDQLGGNT